MKGTPFIVGTIIPLVIACKKAADRPITYTPTKVNCSDFDASKLREEAASYISHAIEAKENAFSYDDPAWNEADINFRAAFFNYTKITKCAPFQSDERHFTQQSINQLPLDPVLQQFHKNNAGEEFLELGKYVLRIVDDSPSKQMDDLKWTDHEMTVQVYSFNTDNKLVLQKTKDLNLKTNNYTLEKLLR